jgi:hypothetical protein
VVRAIGMKPIGISHTVLSRDGTRIGYLSMGGGPSVLVVPGVLTMAADDAAFARALSEHFTIHTIERRGRGESGPQGDDYSIVKECEDVLALEAPREKQRRCLGRVHARRRAATYPENASMADEAAPACACQLLPPVTKDFPRLDHFGIERTAPREVAKAVGDYFRS